MEGSGKWPHDRLAIRHIKAAFHIRLGDLLKKQHNYTCKACPTHLDVWKVRAWRLVPVPYLSIKGKVWYPHLVHPPSPPLCPGWLGVPHPGGVSPRASGAAGERDRWGAAGCEGQWRGPGSGDDHCSQAITHQHAARVNKPPNTKGQLFLVIKESGSSSACGPTSCAVWKFQTVLYAGPAAFQCFFFLTLCSLGSSSSTRVSEQRAAWRNAGWALSSWATTWRRRQPTCWWRHFSYIPHPSRPPGSYLLIFFFSLPTPLVSRICVFIFTSLCWFSGSRAWISLPSSALHRWASCVSFICSPPLTGGTTRWSLTSIPSSQASPLIHTLTLFLQPQVSSDLLLYTHTI